MCACSFAFVCSHTWQRKSQNSTISSGNCKWKMQLQPATAAAAATISPVQSESVSQLTLHAFNCSANKPSTRVSAN